MTSLLLGCKQLTHLDLYTTFECLHHQTLCAEWQGATCPLLYHTGHVELTLDWLTNFDTECQLEH